VTTPNTIHTPDGFIPQAPPGPPYLTLRDQFAMAALTGVLANPENDSFEHEAFAIEAYRYADAMMKARGE
jgi:hypothetical protein